MIRKLLVLTFFFACQPQSAAPVADETPAASAEQPEGVSHRFNRDDFASQGDGWMGGAKVIPNLQNGVLSGMKLFAIRPDSLLAKMGFMNGDLVREINGQKVDSLSAWSSLQGELSTKAEVKVLLSRRGERVVLAYQLAE